MLIEGCAPEASFDLRSNDYQSNLSSAMSKVGFLSLVKDDEQQSVLLELGTRKYRVDVGLEPIVRLTERTIMSIVVVVRYDKAETGQLAIIHVCRELREGYQVLLLRRIPSHIA